MKHPLRAHAFAALAVALAALTAGPAAAHDSGQARVAFTVQSSGAVTAHIELARVDVLDLAGVEKATPVDDTALAALVDAGLGDWLALAADGRPCPLTVDRTAPLGLKGVAIDATAACPDTPPLTIEWRAATHPRISLAAVGTLTRADGLEQPIAFTRAQTTYTAGDITFAAFLWSGVEHIIIGWDHLAFLLALLLACSRLGRVLAVVTAFTVAHSVTLILGATGAITLPSSVVEAIIAASIAVAAAYALFQLKRGTLDHPGRPAIRETDRSGLAPLLAVCFGFGLVHGLGFAGLLAELVPDGEIPILPLIGFNLGVELGQVACVAVVFPLLVIVGRSDRARPVFGALLTALVALGAVVAVQRLL